MDERPERQVILDIDALIDEHLAEGQRTVANPWGFCPKCNGEFHGLPTSLCPGIFHDDFPPKPDTRSKFQISRSSAFDRLCMVHPNRKSVVLNPNDIHDSVYDGSPAEVDVVSRMMNTIDGAAKCMKQLLGIDIEDE